MLYMFALALLEGKLFIVGIPEVNIEQFDWEKPSCMAWINVLNVYIFQSGELSNLSKTSLALSWGGAWKHSAPGLQPGGLGTWH